MTPEKALELVGKYARLTRAIKLQTEWISANLDRCRGVNGKRGQQAATLEELLAQEDDRDDKGRDKNLHLWNWYQPSLGDDCGPEWEVVTAEEHGKECVHCYTAHLAIQLRKQARKDLGIVKRAMSRAIINKD